MLEANKIRRSVLDMGCSKPGVTESDFNCAARANLPWKRRVFHGDFKTRSEAVSSTKKTGVE
jgi:hypothetical protein